MGHEPGTDDVQLILVEQRDDGIWTTYCAACRASTSQHSRIEAEAVAALHGLAEHALEGARWEWVDLRRKRPHPHLPARWD